LKVLEFRYQNIVGTLNIIIILQWQNYSIILLAAIIRLIIIHENLL